MKTMGQRGGKQKVEAVTAKGTIEIFRAGCPACEATVLRVREPARPTCEVLVLDMKEPAEEPVSTANVVAGP